MIVYENIEKEGGKMWTDNASKIDMLFYDPYAEIITNTALNVEDENPLTIGVFGLWGAGKSTLLNLIENKCTEIPNVLCVWINAWMFEGYEDSKTAMMESLLEALCEKDVTGNLKTGLKKLIKRIDWFKLGTKGISIAAPIMASIASGNPLPMLFSVPQGAEAIEKTFKSVADSLQKVKDDYFNDTESDTDSIVANVRKFRKEFEEIIGDNSIQRVVVLVDDLDRCQPERIIESMEAIKLFLSVKKTTFVIAADENVIQYAIKKKYPPLSETGHIDLAKEYIEKIIQLPISIPELSSKDIQNYLMLLVYQQYLDKDQFEKLVKEVIAEKLMTASSAIKNEQMSVILQTCELSINNKEFQEMLDIVNLISPIVASTLKGNPRQAKRFLNTFIMKRRLSQLYYDDKLDMRIMAKLLVLDKLDHTLFVQLNEWNKTYDGEIEQYRIMRETIFSEKPGEYSKWATKNVAEWVACEPVDIEKYCLDKYFYLTREALDNKYDDSLGISDNVKKLLEKVSNLSFGQTEKIVAEINKCTPDELNDFMRCTKELIRKDIVIPEFYQGIYMEFSGYRSVVIEGLLNREKNIEMTDIPALKSMYKYQQEEIKTLLSKLTEKKKITEAMKRQITED